MLPATLIAEVKRLEIKARRLATDTLSGEYASAFHGRGMEFQEVREYVPGDDVRAIDWNVTARTSVPHIKVYREERELTMMLVVDVSASMRAGHIKSRLAVATELASVLAWLTQRNQDRVGLLLFTDRVEHYVAPKKGRAHVWRVIKDLYTFQPQKHGKTDISVALKHLQNVLHRKATLFLISDFWSQDYRQVLKTAAKQHDLTCVTIRDDLLEALPEAGLVRWVDSETGTTKVVDTSDPQVQASYRSAQLERRRGFEQLVRHSGSDHLEVSTKASVVPPLASYLKGRSLKGGRV